MDEYFNAPDMTVAQDIAKERRARAAKLVDQAMKGGGQMVGRVYVPKNPLANLAEGLAGGMQREMADRDLKAEQDKYRRAEQAWLAEKPDELARTGDPQLFERWMQKGQQFKDRAALEMQFANRADDRRFRHDEATLTREQRAEEARLNREARVEEKNADRENRLALRQMPTQHINITSGSTPQRKAPSGYRWNGDELEAIPGGPADKPDGGAKPLTGAQEKEALALGSEFATMKNLADSFKDTYSGDLRSSLEREFGKVAGGAAPQSTQEMTRWWSDQAMFDELPKRHSLFGAALTATEQKSWKDAAISPGLSPKVIRERLATRQRIVEEASGRMRASAVAGGRSGQQFDAATGGIGKTTPKPEAKPVQSPVRRKFNPATGEFE